MEKQPDFCLLLTQTRLPAGGGGSDWKHMATMADMLPHKWLSLSKLVISIQGAMMGGWGRGGTLR